MKAKSGSKSSSYHPSGKIDAMAWIYFLVVNIGLLPIVGFLYAVIIWYLPIIFFNPFITVLFAFAIIIAHNLLVIEYGKVRNIQFANFSGHIAVAIALFAHWLVWIALADAGRNLIEGFIFFLHHPVELFKTAITINREGTWWDIHGRSLAIVWIIETLIIYFWVMSAVKKKVRMPFSEVSQKWLKPEELSEKEFQETKPTIESSPRDVEYSEKIKKIANMNKPHSAEELINSLNRKGYKVSFEKYLRENPDPREVSYYEQSSVTIGSQRINLWSNSALYIEESNLVCLLAESVNKSWHYEITIVNTSSLEKESFSPECHYQHEVEMIGSSKNMFTIKVKDKLLHIDVSNFPAIKIIQEQIDQNDSLAKNAENKSMDTKKSEHKKPKSTSGLRESNSAIYCSIAGDTIISNAPDRQKRQMLLSDIWAIIFYKGYPDKDNLNLYLIIRDKHSTLRNEFYITVGCPGYLETLNLLADNFQIHKEEIDRLSSLEGRLFEELWHAPVEDTFEILPDQKFSEDFHLGYEIQTNVPLFLPWSTTHEEIINDPAIPKIIKNEVTCIECPIRFGPIVVKGPHPIFENEARLQILHKVEGPETFNNLRRSIESLGPL
ncbi:MAG: hypothetical protein HC811_11885 [Flammeovirgaceae bacterium]|nr:hypothetical protein [Flammeovirgaceae bacterium]